jgi:hypothetical protein
MIDFVKKKHPYFTPIWLIQIWLIIEMIFKLISQDTSQLFSLVRYFVFFVATIMLVRSLFKHKAKINFITILFFLWVFWMLIAAIPDLFDGYYNYVKFKQFISGELLMYITIFIIGAKLDIEFYRRLFIFSYQMIIIYLVISIPLFLIFIQDPSYGAEGYTFFASVASILVLTLPYHSERKRTIIILSSLVAIVIMMILARRNKVVYFGSVLFFAYFINIFFKTTFNKQRKGVIVKSAVVLLLFTSMILLIFSDQFNLFWNRMDTGMDSREGIIDLFKEDFNKTPQDWIWGRGIFGAYEGGALATDEKTGLRGGIENGYYETFLKGGGVFLVLLSLISLNAAYKGFFKSNNLLCKGFAALLIVFFISMIAMNQYSLSLKGIIIYVAIAACNSKELRRLPDKYLENKIGLK